jgi:hypothetical protein
MADPTNPTTPSFDPTSVVMITLKDVWLEVAKMRDDVAHMAANTPQLVDHENRVRSLERWRYALPTSMMIALGSAAVTIYGTVSHK